MTKAEPFGQVAIRMGFVSESQVQAALGVQESMQKAGKQRRLIGMILLDLGMISSQQLIDILKYYEQLGAVKHIAPDPSSPGLSN
jgi:hypothetical protein